MVTRVSRSLGTALGSKGGRPGSVVQGPREWGSGGKRSTAAHVVFLLHGVMGLAGGPLDCGWPNNNLYLWAGAPSGDQKKLKMKERGHKGSRKGAGGRSADAEDGAEGGGSGDDGSSGSGTDGSGDDDDGDGPAGSEGGTTGPPGDAIEEQRKLRGRCLRWGPEDTANIPAKGELWQNPD